jgi:NAD(P) transhydrogenase subunit alpha
VKEQIESLGGKFVDVPFETQEERDAAEGVGGYARPMPASWLARQAVQVHERAKQSDIVITTALIPGRDAPTLISPETVQAMRPGSVIIDLAAGRGAELPGQPGVRGGNCPLTEADKVVTKHGVTIVGHTNLPAMVAADASSLYARNLFDFLKLIVTKEGALNIDMSDDIVAATLLTRDGALARKA